MLRQVDPTRTLSLRTAFVRSSNKKVKELVEEIRQLIVDDDAFGLTPFDSFVVNAERGRWRFLDLSGKVDAFKDWLQEKVDNTIIQVGRVLPDRWFGQYVEDAYRRGLARAYRQMRPAEFVDSPVFGGGGRNFFLSQTLARGRGAIDFLLNRVSTTLQGITDDLKAKLSNTLANGLTQGKTAQQLVDEMVSILQGITTRRAGLMARTEIIRAHAEAVLDGLASLGASHVRALVEFRTVGDDRVCPICAGLEGTVYTIEEARGIIPVHPDCRCSWVSL
jgi:SPP1 gp7 family putative phage head morphogenesis protein